MEKKDLVDFVLGLADDVVKTHIEIWSNGFIFVTIWNKALQHNHISCRFFDHDNFTVEQMADKIKELKDQALEKIKSGKKRKVKELKKELADL